MMTGVVLGQCAARQPSETMAFTVFKGCWYATVINEKPPSRAAPKRMRFLEMLPGDVRNSTSVEESH